MPVQPSTPGCLRPCRLPARIVLCAVLFAAAASAAGDADPAASGQPYSSRRTAAAVHGNPGPAQPSGLFAAPRPADRATLVALRAALGEPDSRRRPRGVPAVLPVESFTGGLALDPLSKDAMANQSEELGHADRFAPGTQGGDVVLTTGWLRTEPAAQDQRGSANPLRSETLPEGRVPRRLPRANPLRASASASSRLN